MAANDSYFTDDHDILTNCYYGDCFSSRSVASVTSHHHYHHHYQPRWTNESGQSKVGFDSAVVNATDQRSERYLSSPTQTGSSTALECHVTTSSEAEGFAGAGHIRWDHLQYEADDAYGHVTGSQVTGSEMTGSQVPGCKTTTVSPLTRNPLTGNQMTGSKLTGSRVTGSVVSFVDVHGYDATGSDDYNHQRSTGRWPPVGFHGNGEELDNELPLYPWMNVIGQSLIQMRNVTSSLHSARCLC